MGIYLNFLHVGKNLIVVEVDAYIEVDGKKHCEGDFGDWPFGNFTHVSPFYPESNRGIITNGKVVILEQKKNFYSSKHHFKKIVSSFSN